MTTTTTTSTENKGAYFGKASLKKKYVLRMKGHIAADQLIHGTYWRNCKGCAIGCVVEKAENPHQQMVEELNLPLDIVYLYESIFEHLQEPHDTQFPLRVLEAIKPGADLSLVRPRFLHWLLSDEMRGILQHLPTWKKNDPKDEYTSKVVAAIKQTTEVMKDWMETGKIDESAAKSAKSAAKSAKSAAKSAESAAESAWSAAKSAARTAAKSAKSAAKSAESAAKSAAKSAESAESAWSATWSAAKSAESAWSATWSATWSAAKSAESAWYATWSAEQAVWVGIANKFVELLTSAEEVKTA